MKRAKKRRGEEWVRLHRYCLQRPLLPALKFHGRKVLAKMKKQKE